MQQTFMDETDTDFLDGTAENPLLCADSESGECTQITHCLKRSQSQQ